MAKLKQYRRLFWLTTLLAFSFLALGYRLVDVQYLQHEQLRSQAQRQTRLAITRVAQRGEIRDVRGHALAASSFVKTICADPTLMKDRQNEVARVLAPLLNTNEHFLRDRFQPRVLLFKTNGQPVFDRYVILKKKVRIEEWEQIAREMRRATFGFDTNRLSRTQKRVLSVLRETAVFAENQDDQLRVYPNHALAAHVLGYVGSDGQGLDGVELTMNAKLNGVRGWRETEKDGSGQELVAFRDQDVEPRPGLNVVLTIDAGVQHIVESELTEAMQKHTPVSASCIVVRPKTGEILAMSTLPNFDPNDAGAVEPEFRRNRVITDLAEPGSTFKIVVVATALQEQLVSLEDRFDCEQGRFVFGGKVLRDDHRYGVLSVENIITKSSNIGAAKIGLKVGPEKLHQFIQSFGFGAVTYIPLPGEIRGIVHPLNKWTKLSITRIPMGHEVAATPLQMVMAMSAIANGGRLMRPMLIDRLEDHTAQVVAKYQPQMVRRVLGESAARQMIDALKTVVSTNGTAPAARLDYFTVAGKTGTAQKAVGGRYLDGKYFSSFIGFLPTANPEICISVVMDDPKHGYYGGTTAAPIFKNIAERAANYLNVRPDIFPGGSVAVLDRQPGVRSAKGN